MICSDSRMYSDVDSNIYLVLVYLGQTVITLQYILSPYLGTAYVLVGSASVLAIGQGLGILMGTHTLIESPFVIVIVSPQYLQVSLGLQPY